MIDFLAALWWMTKNFIAMMCVMVTIVCVWLLLSLAVTGDLDYTYWRYVIAVVVSTILGGLCWPKEGEE